MPTKKTRKPYVMVRTYSAGVFAGTLDSRNGKEVVLLNARRICIRAKWRADWHKKAKRATRGGR